METGKRKISLRKIVTLLSIAFFYMAVQDAMTTFAAEWNLWPKGRNAAGETGKPESSAAAAAGKAGEEAGNSVASGLSVGTIGLSLAIVAGTIAIGISTFSGDSSTVTHH